MKKPLLLILSLFIFSLPLGVSADHQHQNPAPPEEMRQQQPPPEGDSLPANWHDRRDMHMQQLKPIDKPEWRNKFPGLKAFSWRGDAGKEFRYHGQRINKAVFFYNDNDELVRIGFSFDGAFIIINPDHGEERHHEEWMRQHP